MIKKKGGKTNIGAPATTNPLITDVDGCVQRWGYESDRRHRVTISGVYRLPFGREDSGTGSLASRIAGGWEVAGMWLFNSGRPWGLPQNVFYVKDAAVSNV